MSTTWKTCKECGQTKSVDDFYRRAIRKYGHDTTCKICLAERRKPYRSSDSYKAMVAENRRKRHANKDGEQLKKSRLQEMLYSSRGRARKAGLDHDLDLQYLESILPDACPVFGAAFDFSGNRTSPGPWSPSLDRFVPSKGYTKGNITIISHRANTLKSDGSLQEHWKLLCWMMQTERDLDSSSMVGLEVAA